MFFFFDPFGFIFNSAVFKDATFLFRCFLEGQFDSEFQLLFDAFEIVYHRELKIQYLYLFLYFKIYMISKNMPTFLESYANKIMTLFQGDSGIKNN